MFCRWLNVFIFVSRPHCFVEGEQPRLVHRVESLNDAAMDEPVDSGQTVQSHCRPQAGIYSHDYCFVQWIVGLPLSWPPAGRRL